MNKKSLLVLITFSVLSCQKEGPKTTKEELIAIETAVKKNRLEKDDYFKSADSPLNDSLKTLFHGLEYFPFNPEYVFKVNLNLYDNPREVDMVTSKGKVKHYVEYGYFEFYLGGKQKLNVFRPKPLIEGHSDYLFIPFKDATTGVESYPAGRYMELDLDESIKFYTLNFNTAYNPWCAYNTEKYNCPYPPKENVLNTAIHAGEKKFNLSVH
jgi:hypothetical protein